MPRPIILGVCGDSASGKTTITRGLVELLGEADVTHVGADDYHRYDRKQRAERAITPLHPDCNYMDVMQQHFAALRAGRPILKPVYRHGDGTFGPPVRVAPRRFTVIEGLLGFHTAALRELYDVRVFLAPPESIRRRWKVDRDCTKRGYTTDQVLEELDRREPDSAAFIRPQKATADIVVSFSSAPAGRPGHLDARVILRDTLRHPDLSPFTDREDVGLLLADDTAECTILVSGETEREHVAEVEEAVWSRMQFASHLRTERLGEFAIGPEVHRSASLGIVQLIILYHLLTARASVALGGHGSRADRMVA